MSEWIDVPVAEVAKGDEIKVRGTGRVVHQVISYYYAEAERWRAVTQVDDMIVWFGPVHIDRLNITAVRRRTPEPSPQPGDWRCRVPGTCPECLAACGCISREVFRASGGWSRDTRTGQPWVMQIGDPVEVVIKAVAGNLASAFAGLPKAIAMAGWSLTQGGPRFLYESLEDTYKRERLDVRPVDRRGKR